MDFAAGQQWAYRAPGETSGSRIVIGAILEFDGGARIICCAVRDALPGKSGGGSDRIIIPFLPMTEAAFARTVTESDGIGELPDDFGRELETWRSDPRGVSYFTVPFEGSLERMIALQMAALVQKD